MKDGGIVIMATPCPEGASREHPELERYGYRGFSATDVLVRTGKVSTVVGHHLVQGGRLLERARRVVLVSNHLDAALAGRLNLSHAATVRDAFSEEPCATWDRKPASRSCAAPPNSFPSPVESAPAAGPGQGRS